MDETRKKRGPAPTAPCGTRSAYNRHLRYDEPPCDACRDAYNQYQIVARNKRAATGPLKLRLHLDAGPANKVRALADRNHTTVDDIVAALIDAGLAVADNDEVTA